MASRPTSRSDCIFCDPDPCTCDITPTKAKAAAIKRQTKAAPLTGDKPAEQTVEASIVAHPAGKRLQGGPIKPIKIAQVAEKKEPAKVITPQLTHTVTPEELEFNVSIQALADTLSDEEKKTYAHILNRPPTRDEKIVAWNRLRRYRRGR